MGAPPVLDPYFESYYQSQIGVLRWMVELGWADINTEVSIMTSCLAPPREGHIEAVLHVYSYLFEKHNTRLALDLSYPEIDKSQF